MPVVPSIKTTRISQQEFKELSHEAMRHVFAIHNEFGRFFDEKIYKRELAARMPNVSLEVAVELTHGPFVKRLLADAIISDSGLFEFKTADAIHPKHRSQTVQYLLLFDLAHAKIVNMRTDQVQHEFVNCQQSLQSLRKFDINREHFEQTTAGAHEFCDHLVSLLRDWGTGLQLSLYEEALEHHVGIRNPEHFLVKVVGSHGHLGDQRMRLIAPHVAFKLTAMRDSNNTFQTHAKRLIKHTSLELIQWANIRNGSVTFKTVR